MAIAIDFSRPDTFIDESYVRRYLDDVELAVKAVGESFRDFSVFVFSIWGIFLINCFPEQVPMARSALEQKFLHISENPKSSAW